MPWLLPGAAGLSALDAAYHNGTFDGLGGNRDIYAAAGLGLAPRKHQHEYAGEPREPAWHLPIQPTPPLRQSLPDRQVYFDAVLLIPGFLLLGKALEARAKRRALAAVNALSWLRPPTARRIVGGVETVVPLEEVRIGDKVLVLPGERFPVDAKIVDGRTSVRDANRC